MTGVRRSGVVEGALVVVGLALVPLALTSALRTPVAPGLTAVVDVLAAIAVTTWCVVVWSIAGTVRSALRNGASAVEPGPIGWAAVRVAALLLLVASFLDLSHGAGRGASPTGSAPRPPATGRRAGAPATYLVRPGDTLASIASRVLGDAERWPSIAANNLGRTMSDGSRFDPARTLHPGWSLLVEPDGRHGLASASTQAAGRPMTRRRGGHRGRRGTSTLAGVLVPLAAELRRRQRTSGRVVLADEAAIDDETELLSAPPSPTSLLAAVARALMAAGRLDDLAHVVVDAGEARLDDESWSFDPASAQVEARCLVAVLGNDEVGTHLAFVPRGAHLALSGAGASSLLDDALRVAPVLGLGRPVLATPGDLLESLALREDGDLVVCVDPSATVPPSLRSRAVVVCLDDADATVKVDESSVTLNDGRVLRRDVLAPAVRRLLDGVADRRDVEVEHVAGCATLRDDGVVVRLLTAVPRVDGLAEPFEPGRERRAVELVAYLALRDGEPVTGERLRVRVLGSSSTDAAAKTLFNVASSLRRALGEGPFGPRLPPAGKLGRYAVSSDVVCDVSLLGARVAQAGRCDVAEEKMAWLRSALELVESEPFATVLEGYDWFLTEGHLARLQATCEDAACELADLALARGLVALARFAIERASLVDPHAERLAAAAMRVAAARQASLPAIEPALRSTVPSAPTTT